MTLLVTMAAMTALLIPGLAVVHYFARRLSPEAKFAIAPALSIVVYAFAGLIGWARPDYFAWISWACVAGATAAGFVTLALTRGLRLFRLIDPVLPAAYALLVLFSTQLTLLPIQITDDFPRPWQYSSPVRKDVLPVRVQTLFGGLSFENLIPYRFAEMMLRGVDFGTPRELACGNVPAIGPGRPIAAVPPLMALVGAHFVNISFAELPREQRPGTLSEFDNDAAYYPFFLVGACLNGLCILPVYLIALRLGGRTAARLAVVLLACNYGMILHTAFISPQALAGYFALLLVYAAINGSVPWAIMGALLALAYYADPCAAGIGIGCCAYVVVNAERRKALLHVARAIGLAAALLAPWYTWVILRLGAPDELSWQTVLRQTGDTWSGELGVRLMNVLRTLFPDFSVSGPSARTFCQNALYTLAGMLGLGLLPFFAASLARRDSVRVGLAIGLVPLLVAGILIGGNHTGLAPLGPWLFVPVAAAFACAALASLSWQLCLGVSLACLIEQALIIWLGAYVPHHGLFLADDWHAPMRLMGLIGLQLAAAVVTISVCLRKNRPSGVRREIARRVIYPSLRPQPIERETAEINA
jgi:hypothetical protein